MGRVAEVRQDSVVVAPNEAHRISPLKAGDGVVFDSAEWRSPQEPEEGGRLFSVAQAKGKRLELTFANSAVDFTRIRPGDILWRSHDPSIDKAVRPFLDAAHPVAKQPLKLEVEAIEGRPLELRWTLMTRPEVEFTQTSDEPLGQAQKRALTPETLRDQLGRLGNTPYRLVDLHAVVQGQPFAPVSILNHLRRQAVEALERLQTALPPIEARPYKAPPPSKCFPTDGQPELHLLVRAPGQLEAAIVARPASITLDYLDFYGLQPSKERIQSAGLLARVASPRILKPDDQRIIHFLRKLDIPVVVRSTGLLWAFTGSPRPDLIGDFSLNAANPISAELLLELGLTRVTPTHDLNADQITRLARQVGGGRIEVVAYQHLPVFHTEHCVFCRFLSTGTSYLDCGRPCEKHLVSLKDDKGRVHPVLADVGCRNTVFGAEAQEASAHLAHWLRAGIRHFRLEFTHETPGQVSAVTEAFNQALQGEITSQTLAQKIRSASPEGTTEGSLFVPPGYLALPVLQ
jgi:putative protease